MSTVVQEIRRTKDFEELKAKLKATWTAGDYDLFSRYMQKGAEEFYARLEVAPGARLLDVACGSGQLALIAARSGATASGCDIAPNWIERARARAAEEGLEVSFRVGDAEELPYTDAQFDVVTSLVGAMFAPRPELVASELIRVCKPGGTIAMANWTPGGFIGQMFKVISKHIAPSGMPSPVLWGDEATVRDRFGCGNVDLKFALRNYRFEYPFSPDEVVEFFRVNYGPMSRAFASLEGSAQGQLRDDLVRLWSAYNKAGDGTTSVDSEYLEVIAIRRGGSNGFQRRTLSRRANALADRIEEGAAALAQFAEGVSDSDWNKPLSSTDRRSIGVVVHHVASVYPVEIELAKTIATGKELLEVTWEVVNSLNGKHAEEQAGVSKTATLELLRQNSSEAAATVRKFADEELDQAAPFGLSYGAPVTAQFVIEDHALRHSWHHLARIRKSLGLPELQG
jgi:ubiquinone/menaquinone biosynthesis C-methylase UbiE